MEYEEVEFDEKLYEINIKENDFSGSETDGVGEDKEDDENANNES